MTIQNLTDNPTNSAPRLAISLCLDVSLSMDGKPLDELRAALAEFYALIRRDPQVAATAQIGITVFAGSVLPYLEFDNLPENPAPPELTIRMKGLLDDPKADLGSGTKLGLAAREAVRLIDERLAENSRLGLPVFRPFLVVISDGCSTETNFDELAAQIRKRDVGEEILVVPVGVGKKPDLAALSALSHEHRPAFHVADPDKYRAIFGFLFQSAKIISVSSPGDTRRLPADELITLSERPADVAQKPLTRKGWGNPVRV